MKKIITLIDDLDYDYKYLEKTRKEKSGEEITYLDTNNMKYKIFNLEKITYSADEMVYVDSELEYIANEITDNFKNTFTNRGREATEEQIYFANETAKIVLGKAKDDWILIDPAPCGFGKSTIKAEILRYYCTLYEKKLTTDGVIIVGDRLVDLKQLQEDLGELKKHTYLLEGWNQEVCKDSTKKASETGMCIKCTFPHCRIKKQIYEQKDFPILLMTNARLKEFGEQVCDKYIKYNNGMRKTLLIDEKPQILNTIKVDKALLNKIDTAISNVDYEEATEKTQLTNYWDEIIQLVNKKMIPLRENGFKRFILSNNSNIGVCKDNEPFMKLWNKYMKYNFSNELNHIHTVLTQGGFYVYEKTKEFISTIGYNHLRQMYNKFDKVIIFDGSSLYDPEYIALYDYDKENDIDYSDIRYLYVPNTRTYNNLKITVNTNHKLTKTEFINKRKYLVRAIADYINNKVKIGFLEKTYVVTYKDESAGLGALLDNSLKIPKMPTGQTYYFGNTKGSNEMDDCTRMFNIGWDTIPDYETAIMYLSCYYDGKGEKRGTGESGYIRLLKNCLDRDRAIMVSDIFTKKNRNVDEWGNRTYSSGDSCQYCFGWMDVDEFQYLDIVSKFYQEIHRTKLRDYTYQKDIKIYVFQTKHLIYRMLNCLLPECHIDYNKNILNEFQRAKDNSFSKENGTKTIAQKFLDWEKEWNGEKINISEIKNKCEMDSEGWKNVKKNKSVKTILNNCTTIREGKEYYLIKN